MSAVPSWNWLPQKISKILVYFFYALADIERTLLKGGHHDYDEHRHSKTIRLNSSERIWYGLRPSILGTLKSSNSRQ